MTILVCRCGARLNAPGAIPGRVGKCPSCGSALRVPEIVSAVSIADRPPDPDPSGNSASTHLPSATADKEPGSSPKSGAFANKPSPVFVPRRRLRKRNAGKTLVDRLDAWQGLVARPDRPESTIRGSLLYPLWDVDGFAFLSVFSIVWWFLTFIPFSMVVDGLIPTSPVAKLVAPVFLGHLLVFGYTLLYLGDVLVTSVAGDVRHPRWPSGDPSEIIRGLSRWFWAFLIGGVLGLFPSVWYWIRCGKVDTLDWIVLVDLVVPGVAYGQMALVASLLFDDPLGANPITVGLALWRVGLRCFRPALVVSVALISAAAFGGLIMAVSIPALSLFMLWIFLIFILYEALVVMRILGLEYRRHARKIGWFRDRQRRSS